MKILVLGNFNWERQRNLAADEWKSGIRGNREKELLELWSQLRDNTCSQIYFNLTHIVYRIYNRIAPSEGAVLMCTLH
jgi:hypothetical protein